MCFDVKSDLEVLEQLRRQNIRFHHYYDKGKEWRKYLEKRKAIRKANNPYYNQWYE